MKFKIKTLSPIHIGSGDTISPYHDFIFDDGYVHYIDEQKLQNYLFNLDNSEKIIDEFVEIVKNQANHKKDLFGLKRFFIDNSIDFTKFTEKKIKMNTKVTSEIQQIESSTGRPYIPGSTIKGAIRTALLFGELLDQYDLENIERYSNYNGQNIFKGDIFKNLLVSDSSLLKNKNIDIKTTYNYHLEKEEKQIPLYSEVIPANTEMEIDITCKGLDTLKNDFSYLKKGNELNLLNKLYTYNIKNIANEIKILNDIDKRKFKYIIKRYKKIYNIMKTLYESKNGAVIRIGAGKTFYDNSILRAFNGEDHKKVLKDNQLSKNGLFPKTRTFIYEQENIRNILGWIEIRSCLNG